MLRSVINWLKKRKIAVLLLIFTFIISGLIVNLVQLLTLPLYWINKKLFRQMNAIIVYFHWCIIPWALETWADYDIRMFGDNEIIAEHANTEHALVVLNHRGDLDWMIGWVYINNIGMLGGTKAIMKDIAKYLPGIGWSFIFMEYPLLKRDWNKDKARLAAACKNLADYPVNMLLCLFAEGTRFTAEKHKLSMEYAEKNGLPIFRHHLIPRTKGFCFLMEHMGETFGAIYDVTICYRGPKEPSIMGVVNAESCGADICVRRIPISSLPLGSDKELSEWLINLYKEKDDLVEYHNQHKNFPYQETYSHMKSWANLIVGMWICLCSVPLFLMILYLAWIGKWLMLVIAVAAIALADKLFQMIAREAETAKTSSSYGLKPVINGAHHTSRATTTTEDTLDTSSNNNKKRD